MFETKKALPLFPTTVRSFQIPTDAFRRINGGLRIMLDRLIAAAPDQNHEGGWQTEHDLHTLPEMEELNGYFMNAVNDVISVLSTKHREVEITGCWANISPPGGSHTSHMHPNNFLSAVYYVTVPPGGHRITFYDPRHQIHILAPAFDQVNIHNSDNVNIEAEEGMLLLFPSWLVHSVPVNTSNESRISISFNINFKNFSGRLSPPTWKPDLPTHPNA
jgi:uncharacterized protein (TIGR02466 family)